MSGNSHTPNASRSQLIEVDDCYFDPRIYIAAYEQQGDVTVTTVGPPRLIHVTFFVDQYAKTLQTSEIEFAKLQPMILQANANTKEQLCWIKLAKFGDVRTVENCLRHDANVLSISGIEADYDDEVMSFDEAVEIARIAKLHCTLYTSPSHTIDQPRWRILCPTSCDLPPEQRYQLLARLNGLYGGIFSSESFTLSQSYYYGRVNGNDQHQAICLSGDYIDLRNDLDAGAIGKITGDGDDDGDFDAPIDVQQRLDAMTYKGRDDTSIHKTQVAVSASLLNRGYSTDEVVGILLPVTVKVAGRVIGKDWDWLKETRGIRKMCRTWIAKRQASDDEVQRIIGPFVRLAPATIRATPFTWRDPKTIPQREWLYYPYYIREFVTVTIGSGGKGKSTLLTGEALVMASGLNLLGTDPTGPLRVWYWNGEDPMLEIERRFAAGRKYHNLQPKDFEDRLFVDSGRVMPIVIVETRRGETRICNPVVEQVIATLKENRIDVLIIDPFVSCRRVSENDNDAIDMVAKKWGHIAEEAHCNVHLAHHTRKGMNEYTTIEDARGAKSLIDASRAARVINIMGEREAEKAGIREDEREFYLRSDNAKKNLTPTRSAHWYKLDSINLQNGIIRLRGVPTDGDAMGVATPWEYVEEVVQTTPQQITRALDLIAKGGPFRLDQRATKEPWVGIPIATVFGYNLDKTADKTKVMKLINDWLQSKLLVKVPRKDRSNHDRTYVEVTGQPAAASQ